MFSTEDVLTYFNLEDQQSMEFDQTFADSLNSYAKKKVQQLHKIQKNKHQSTTFNNQTEEEVTDAEWIMHK